MKRAQIIALRDEGLSIRAIASRMAISATTVNKWIKRHQETGLLTSLRKLSCCINFGQRPKIINFIFVMLHNNLCHPSYR